MKVSEAIAILQKCNPEATLEESEGSEVISFIKSEKDARVSSETDEINPEDLGEGWEEVA